MLLQSRGLRRAEQAVHFRYRRSEPHGREELARRTERHLRLGVAQRGQGAALAEQGVGALGDVPERAPALGRPGVELGGVGLLARGLDELRLGRGEGVFVERGDRFHARGQALGERPVVEGERDPEQARQAPHVIGIDASAVELVELAQQLLRLLALAPREEKLGDGGERERDQPR